jgi:transcription elongation factor Elf1
MKYEPDDGLPFSLCPYCGEQAKLEFNRVKDGVKISTWFCKLCLRRYITTRELTTADTCAKVTD